MSDLTRLSIIAQGASFSTCEGRLRQIGHHVFPETYICMTLSDGFVYILPQIYLGKAECNEDGEERIVAGSDVAQIIISAFKASGVVDLTQWLPFESPTMPLNTDSYHASLRRFGAGLW